MNDVKQKFDEVVQAIRWRGAHERFRLADEIRIIRGWVLGLAVVAFLAFQALPVAIHYTDRDPSPLAVLVAMGLGGGLLLMTLVLLFGYVNADARRRGMHSTLWTLVAVFVPYLMGVVAYFLVREPLPFNCPQCGATVSSRFNFCPACKHNLRPACPQCKRDVRPDDKYCPHCAQELKAATT
ncbi:MAG: zinc ribbon domain-containing protein [Terriglobia bacterium]